MLIPKMKHKQGGFTIVELMFTIVIIGVLLGLGAPNFRDFLRNARLSAAANDMIGALNLARSESVKRRFPMSVCSSNGGTSCDNGNFSKGWIVFVDVDGDGTVDSGDEVIEKRGAVPDSITIVSVTEPDPDKPGSWTTSAVSEFTYAPNGFRIVAAGGVPGDVAVTFCDDRLNKVISGGAGTKISAGRVIDVSNLGRAHVLRDASEITERAGCTK
jgi:prepilin-type N-terminal cleavage/methylation domain-containing protein